MKRFLSLLTVIAFIGITNVWGQSDVYTSCVTLTAGTNGSSCKVRLSSTGTQYDAMKLGTGTKTGTMTFKVPSGTTKIYIHVAGWNNDGASRKLNISASKGTLGSSSIDLTNDTGISGSSTTFTLGTPGNATGSYYAAISISNVTAESTITLTTSAKRAVVWGVNYGKYTVSYNSNGGSGTMTDSYSPYPQSGQVTVKSNSFTAPTGKTFNGWKTGATSGTSYAAGAKFSISANTTLYAQWACITPTISSQTVSSATYTAGDTPSNLSVTASGGSLSYQWKQSATENGTYVNVTSGTGGTTKTYTPSTSAASDLWYQCTVTNTGSSCGTTALSNKAHIVVNEAVACTATPTVGVVSLNGSFSLTQLPLTCSVTDEGGTGCSISAVGFVWKAGSDPTASDNPKAGTYSNGTITGSLPSSGSFAANGTTYYIKAYATNGAGTAVSSSSFQFTPLSVTFNNQGHGSTPETQYLKSGDKAEDPNFTNITGYTFGGWFTNEGCTAGNEWDFTSNTVTLSNTTNGNITLYAKWTVKTHAFAWSWAGGETTSLVHTDANANMPYGTAITYPANSTMSKTGYNFTSWSSNATTMPDADLTITAQWQAKTTAITLNKNNSDASGTEAGSASWTYDQTAKNSITAATRKGYTVDGYYTATSGGTKILNADGSLAGNDITVDAVVYTNDGKWAYNDTELTLYAQWSPITYTVAFNKNNASASGSMDNQTGFTYGVGKQLSKNTFTIDASLHKYFAGWSKSSTATEQTYTDEQSVTDVATTSGTITLYAVWKDYTYTNYRIICCTKHNVELAGDGTVTGGTFSSDKNRACENDPVVLTAVAATGYDFTSWDATYSDGEIKHATFVDATANPGTMNMPAYSATVTPTFTPITYNISYENMTDASYTEGSNPTTYTIVSEDITLIAPVKDEYKFDGWFTDADLAVGHKVNGVAISTGTIGDKTFYAKWVEDNKWSVSITDPEHGTVTVKWNDGSEHSMSEGSEDILKDTEITIEVEGDTGYELDELRINGELADPGTMDLTDNTTIAATFKLTTYNITYHLNGGSGAENTTYNYLSGKITLPAAPTVNKTGHTFLGWFATEGLTGSAVTEIAANSTGHKEYWASWSINSYQLTWALNGGTIKTAGTAAGEIVYNSDITAPVVEKEGYHFTGWSEEVPAKMPAEDKTYTAQWEINTYAVKWYVNGNEWKNKGGSTSVEHGAQATLPTAPTKADGCGDKFMGWTTEEDYTGNGAPDPLYTTPPTITGDIEFYAVFADYGE